jgi:hypothetical protein
MQLLSCATWAPEAPEWHCHLNAGRRAKFQLWIFSYTILVELAN